MSLGAKRGNLIKQVRTKTMIKKHLKTIIVLTTMLLVAAFWFSVNSVNVYDNAALGAMAEILWLPFILLTIGTPVLAIVFWAQQKYSWKSPFPYLAVLSLWPLLFL